MKTDVKLTQKDIVEVTIECAKLLDEKKAVNTVILDLIEVNSYLDYFIITTGNSITHCRALAKELSRFFASKNLKERSFPKLDSEWILLDYNDIIVHIFTESLRDYYQLEKLWHDAKIISY